jgi:hypothetical protein
MLQNYRCCSFLSRSSPNHHPPLPRNEHPPLLQTGFHQKSWINGSTPLYTIFHPFLLDESTSLFRIVIINDKTTNNFLKNIYNNHVQIFHLSTMKNVNAATFVYVLAAAAAIVVSDISIGTRCVFYNSEWF